MKNQGEKLMKEEASKNAADQLENFPGTNRALIVYMIRRKALETFLYRITYNGHFWPSCLLKNSRSGNYDWFYSPHLYFFQKKTAGCESGNGNRSVP